MKNKKTIIIGLLIVLIIVGVIIALLVNKNHKEKLTDLEQIKIEETSKETMLFMEEIDNSESDGIDRYISYALEYSYNINDKNTLSVKEIKDFVASKFTKELDEEELNNIGVTPYLLDRNIFHNPEEKTYTIDKTNLTQPAIARIPVITYSIDGIEKEKDKYIVTYNKYLVENPYEVMNYYNDYAMNLTEEERENYKPYDTSDIYNYLTCKGKITSVKVAITSKNIEKVGKVDKQIKVTYVIEDNNLLVESIN